MREAVLQEHGIQLQHHLRRGPMSPQLLACLRVLAADDHTLRQMLAGSGESLTQVRLACALLRVHFDKSPEEMMEKQTLHHLRTGVLLCQRACDHESMC